NPAVRKDGAWFYFNAIKCIHRKFWPEKFKNRDADPDLDAFCNALKLK
ncbi:MAG: hypothetical protein JSS53_09900, partial [Proteobacteria bacterium]|nr:hypothetical protein [Pseudomonadota bacterium]